MPFTKSVKCARLTLYISSKISQLCVQRHQKESSVPEIYLPDQHLTPRIIYVFG